MKAWLVTWESTEGAASGAGSLAAIFNSRWSVQRVQERVELIHALTHYTVDELARFALRPSKNPYRATREKMVVTCGHNPFLVARLVSDFHVTEDLEHGLETLSWTEPPPAAPVSTTKRAAVQRRRRTLERRLGAPMSWEMLWAREKAHYTRGRT